MSGGQRPARPLGILLLMSAAIVLYVWASAVSLIVADRSSVREREGENAERLAQSLAGFTESLLGSTEIALRYLESWLAENPGADPRFDARFAGLVDIYREAMGGRVDLRMVSAEGGLFYIPSASDRPLADVRDREYYQAQLSLPSGTLHFARSVLSRVTGKWGIPVSYRLARESSGILILFAALELDNLTPRYESALSGPGATIELLREDGVVLHRVPFEAAALGAVADRSPAAGSRSAEARVGGLPLAVRLTVPERALLAAWRRNSALRILVAAVASGTISGLAWVAARQLGRIGAYQARIERLAATDALTGLANRQAFFSRLEAEALRAARYERGLGLIVVDLDCFKAINDRFGHPKGDRALEGFAAALRGALRSTDFPGRIGGEEFAVILPETDSAGTLASAERVVREARQVELPDGGRLTVSAGCAVAAAGRTSVEELYARADAALYAAKRAGRDRALMG